MKLCTSVLAGAAALLLSTGIAAAATQVASADLNIRIGPGTEYPVVGVIPNGAAVDVRRCAGGWCRVNYGGEVGWASSAYLGGSVVVESQPTYYYDYYTSPEYYGPYAYGYGFGPGLGVGGTFFFGGHGHRGYRHFHHRHGMAWMHGHGIAGFHHGHGMPGGGFAGHHFARGTPNGAGVARGRMGHFGHFAHFGHAHAGRSMGNHVAFGGGFGGHAGGAPHIGGGAHMGGAHIGGGPHFGGGGHFGGHHHR